VGKAVRPGGRSNLTMVRYEAQTIAKHLKDRGVIRIAQARGGLDQRIKYPLHIERRPADDLQNVGGGRLLVQCLLQLTGPGLHLLEQPRVLDGDNSLVGESFEQTDLLIREESDLIAPSLNVTDCQTVLEQGNTKDGPVPALPRKVTAFWELVDLGLQVFNVDQAPVDNGPTTQRSTVQRDIASREGAMMCDET
jgi:hypothetical protein